MVGYAGGKAAETLDDVIKAYAEDWHSSEPTKPGSSLKWPESEQELVATAGVSGYTEGAGWAIEQVGKSGITTWRYEMNRARQAR